MGQEKEIGGRLAVSATASKVMQVRASAAGLEQGDERLRSIAQTLREIVEGKDPRVAGIVDMSGERADADDGPCTVCNGWTQTEPLPDGTSAKCAACGSTGSAREQVRLAEAFRSPRSDQDRRAPRDETDPLERGYWRFDALRGRQGPETLGKVAPDLPGPMSERDAFKRAASELVGEALAIDPPAELQAAKDAATIAIDALNEIGELRINEANEIVRLMADLRNRDANIRDLQAQLSKLPRKPAPRPKPFERENHGCACTWIPEPSSGISVAATLEPCGLHAEWARGLAEDNAARSHLGPDAPKEYATLRKCALQVIEEAMQPGLGNTEDFWITRAKLGSLIVAVSGGTGPGLVDLANTVRAVKS